MPKKKITLTPEQQDSWHEIFDDIEMSYLPIEYIDRLLVKFKDGTTWDIDITDSKRKQSLEEIEDSLDEMFEEYDELIDALDFRLDIDRVKHDLTRRVFKFLKLNK